MSRTKIDAKDVRCPGPILQVIKSLQESDVEEVEVIATDPAFGPDIELWCAKTGHKLVDLKEDNGYFIALIQRSA